MTLSTKAPNFGWLKMEQFPLWAGDTSFLGTPMEILKQHQDYTKLGIDLFILRFADEPKLSGIHLFIKQILSKR